jgi:DNA polymerase-3 subunit gamma/tau
MAYQVTARKWRPQRFSDMVGQEHIARTLRNAIVTGRIAHAYLFVGPRGIGKTTSARIFAKALNCKHPIDGEPCCECSSCKAIADESSVDVIEIDGATHTQVEKARDICEDVLHLPVASKYKIYIIDEVHMLSKGAWNALLKTIEEPPAHAKFIFATTEVNKVLPTVISRCQRFDLCRIPSELIAKRLEYIANEEKIKISRSALNVIARAADGGMRDAQSLLDQLVSFFGSASGEETISEEQALSLFGLTAPGEMESLLNSILTNDRTSMILTIHQFAGQGKNLDTLFEEILSWLRGILLCLVLPDPMAVLDENPEKINSYRKLAAVTRPDILQILLEQLAASSYLLRDAINKQVFMETILLKAMRAAHAVKVEDLLIRLNEIRRNGELNGIEKIPTLASIPAYHQPSVMTVPAVPPPQVTLPPPVQTAPSIPADPPHPEPAAEPPSVPPSPVAEQSVSVPEPAPVPAVEPVVPAAEPVPIDPPEEKMTETVPTAEIHNDQPVMEKDEKVTEPVTEIPEPVQTVAVSSDEDPGEEIAEQASQELPEEVPAALAERNGMSLKERFSAELLWSKLTETILRFQPSVGSVMSSGVADRIENSMLYVNFDAKDDTMIYQIVTKAKNMLVQELRNLTGDRFADITLGLKEGIHTPAVPKRTLEELKREVSSNPMVMETADLFAGSIVDVME